jgi:hypothetical protein
MAGFIATLAAAHADNWAICKRERLWGVPHSSNAEKAALEVVPGDQIFIWRAKSPRMKGGLLARAEAAGPAVPAIHPPWPDRDRYSRIFPIKVTDELPVPVGDSFPGNRTSVLFGVQNIWVNWGFWSLPNDVVARMNAALHRG